MMREYGFEDRLEFSRGKSEQTHPDTIRKLITDCSLVQPTTGTGDDRGVDFVATLSSGRELKIDIKAREAGCQKFWKDPTEPELALEIWSIKPEAGRLGKVGWTLDEHKLTDYTLHVFDPGDSAEVFLLPFVLLRQAFKEHGRTWYRNFPTAMQSSYQWKSECVFVPGWCVIDAIAEQMRSCGR